MSDSCHLYVGKLSRTTNSRDLEDIFSEYGKIINARVIRDKGFGFVEFEKASDAKEALEKLNGYVLNKSAIVVEAANKKTPSDNTCFNCNEEGHWAKDCKKSPKRSRDSRSRGYSRRSSRYHPYKRSRSRERSRDRDDRRKSRRDDRDRSRERDDRRDERRDDRREDRRDRSRDRGSRDRKDERRSRERSPKN